MKIFLRIKGQDAQSFLNAQASNDIKSLELDSNQFVAFLSPKAELISLASVTKKSGNEFLIYLSNPEELKEHLERFVIVEDVNLELVSLQEVDDDMAISDLDEFTSGESFIKLVERHPEKRLLEKYVSFTKGCFPGQEPLAKFKNIGLRKREERSQKLLDEGLEIFAHSKDPSELDPAIEVLRKALKENPRNEDAYETLGVLLAKQTKFQEAIMVMHQLEMINPQNQMAQMNLSIFYMKIGDKETAEEHKAKGTVLQFDEALKG